MSILHEVGFKYPCRTQGVIVNPDDADATVLPGQVVEGSLESDYDLPTIESGLAISDILRMKNDYPEFILHYVKFETRRITVQFSMAPPQNGSLTRSSDGSISAISIPLVWHVVLAILAIAGIIVVATGALLKMTRGYIFTLPPPVGHAVIHAKDHETGLGIRDVEIYVDEDYEGTTGVSGSIKVENLLEGDHTFAGDIVEGYHAPHQVTATIIKGKQIIVDLVYYPDDKPKPTTGFLYVNTDPVKGEVYIDAVSYGIAPVGPVELENGKHYVTFGAIDGYITPKQQTAYIQGGENSSIVGEYTTHDDGRWYEKYLKYALIGGGAILGAALLVPEVIRALRRRGRE